MNSMIYNPQEEYDNKFKSLHMDNTAKYFDALVDKSGIVAEENRRTVNEYNEVNQKLKRVKKQLNRLRFFRVLMCITLILIPIVIIKISPKIELLKSELEQAHKKIGDLHAIAEWQMTPLNNLFTDRMALEIIEATIPQLSFAPTLTVEQESDMAVNYDFNEHNDMEQSALDILSGNYNGNPFLFENKLIHKMGLEVYHGYKIIRWRDTYRGSDGKIHTRTRTDTLHATLTKPKPFYETQVLLNYCAQSGDELSFSRDATHLDKKSEKEIDRYVKRGERKLKRLTDKAIKENRDFASLSNSDFEVLFDALDRTDEVQFRALFTPLAQTNMVDLIRSQTGYGDDFNFIKQKRTNKIISKHSQGRSMLPSPSLYASYSLDEARENFIRENANYFKAIYFDFAPLWAIPMYQERPTYSLSAIPESPRCYSYKECEALLNMIKPELIVHPRTNTRAILKASFVDSRDNVDEISVCAYSYDVVRRVDYVSVHGGDGRWHKVAVPWDEYIPLERTNRLFVTSAELAQNRSILAERNNLCIFN